MTMYKNINGSTHSFFIGCFPNYIQESILLIVNYYEDVSLMKKTKTMSYY